MGKAREEMRRAGREGRANEPTIIFGGSLRLRACAAFVLELL